MSAYQRANTDWFHDAKWGVFMHAVQWFNLTIIAALLAASLILCSPTLRIDRYLESLPVPRGGHRG